MLTIQQVNSAIMMQTWSNTELASMIDAVKWARNSLARQVKRGLMLGDTVEFTSSKTGRTLQGTVSKIAIKYVTVNTTAGLWRVPAAMLTPVTEKEYA
jgi:hypothetical protein